jgi:predicted nucleotidyltransferase
MVIGGQAVLLYGEPRLTKDIDITLGVNIDQLGVLLEMVREVPLRPLPNDIPSFVKKTMVLPALDEDSGIRIDFIFSFTPYEREAIARARHVLLSGQQIRFAALEDLIIHKIFAGRPRDLEDVRILVLKNPAVDRAYVEKWLKQFDIALPKKRFLKKFQKVAGAKKQEIRGGVP